MRCFNSDNMAESDITDDFSLFCPASSLPVTKRDVKQPPSKPSSKVKAKVAWFAKKSSSPDPVKRPISPKRHQGRNSLPPDLAVQLDDTAILPSAVSQTSTDACRNGGGGKTSRPLSSPAFPLDALKPLRALQGELDALKGCVSQRRALFSPQRASSPIVHTHDDQPVPTARTSPCSPHPTSPLQQEAVVFPLKEYSVQVEPFIDPTSSSPPSVSPIRHSRRGSLEYDHLEDFDPSPHSVEENGSPDRGIADPHTDNDTYFVTVQFHTSSAGGQEVKPDDIRTHIHSNEAECLDRGGMNEEEQEVEGGEGGGEEGEDLGAYAEEAALSCEQQRLEAASRPPQMRYPPRSLNMRISNSIPSRLNSPNLRFGTTHSDRLTKGLWSSASILQPPSTDPTCHCPACCSCGSSQRQLTSSMSFTHDSTMTEHRDVCSSWPRHRLCPLKRYTSDKLNSPLTRWKRSHSPLPAKKHTVHFSPALPTKYQTAPGHFHARSGTVEMPLHYTTSFVDDDLDDTHSLASSYSHQSVSTFTSSGCCDQTHIPYNKGVDGSVFRQRMQVRG